MAVMVIYWSQRNGKLTYTSESVRDPHIGSKSKAVFSGGKFSKIYRTDKRLARGRVKLSVNRVGVSIVEAHDRIGSEQMRVSQCKHLAIILKGLLVGGKPFRTK